MIDFMNVLNRDNEHVETVLILLYKGIPKRVLTFLISPVFMQGVKWTFNQSGSA